MAHDWIQLTNMTSNKELLVEKVRVVSDDISIEGSFELPPLAKMDAEDQVFIAAFVKSHGSIKEMERIFGISYPTVKSRLNRVGQKLDFIDVEVAEDKCGELDQADKGDILDRIDKGELSAKDALEMLKR